MPGNVAAGTAPLRSPGRRGASHQPGTRALAARGPGHRVDRPAPRTTPQSPVTTTS